MSAIRRDSIDRAIQAEQDLRNLRLKPAGTAGDTNPYELDVVGATGITATTGHALVPGLQTVAAASRFKLSYLEANMRLDFASIRNSSFNNVPGLWYESNSTTWTIHGTARVTGTDALTSLKLAVNDEIQLPVGALGEPVAGVTMNASPVLANLVRKSGGYGVSGTAYFIVLAFMASKADYAVLSDLQALASEPLYFQGPVVQKA